MNAQIEIKEMPTIKLAYVSCIGPQNLEKAYQKLLQRATAQGLVSEHAKMVTIYHDSFKVTEENKVRMSACIMLNQPVKTSG